MDAEGATLTVEALRGNVPRIRRWLERVLSSWAVSAEVAHDLTLAVTEVCTNIIRHGYGERRSGDLEIHIGREGDAICVTIVDSAPVFLPREISAPPPEALAEGGYGLYLIHTLVDEVTYEGVGEQGNRTILVKYDASCSCES